MRQTGRTSRLLNEAMKQAKAGRAVYVMAADERHRRMLEAMAGEEARNAGIKFETSSSCSNFCWETLTLKGAHQNCIVLVDHWAIESRFAKLLNELHRFD